MSETNDYPHPDPRMDLLWVAIDLDGTLAEGIFTPDNPTSRIGPPIKKNVDKLLYLYSLGWKIMIHTARGWNDYETIESWLEHHGIPWDGIVPGKLLAAAYIDDRAINCEDPDWIPKHALDAGRISPK